MIAVIIGSSGLVGQSLLNQLCNHKDFTEIVVLVRKPLTIQHPKIKEIIVDFEHLDQYKQYVKGDVVFSCLGTTKAKSTDSRIYYKVDYEYPVKIAWLAAENKVPQFHIVSSIGAKEKSSNAYLKIKGETEINISVIKFQSTHIYRPSILDGHRNESRPLENLGLIMMKIINPFLLGGVRKYRSIKASDLAKAMITQSLKHLNGTFYYESDEIQRIADQV